LECGSLLPLLRLELARDAAGSKLPTKESGSKLPHSKAIPRRRFDSTILPMTLLTTRKAQRRRATGAKNETETVFYEIRD
jgi:hypothetical protein